MVSVDGFECGRHSDEDDIPNFILLPRAADELKTLFVASGGMAEDLIHDIPTVQERVDRIMAEAEAIITQRLARLAAVG